MSIKTPNQINSSVALKQLETEGINANVILRRVGNVTISYPRSIPSFVYEKPSPLRKVTTALKEAQAKIIADASAQRLRSRERDPLFSCREMISQKVMQMRPILPKPAALTPYENYMKSLQTQNKEMRTMLLECRRDLQSMQFRMRHLTNQINNIIKNPSFAETKVILNRVKRPSPPPSESPPLKKAKLPTEHDLLEPPKQEQKVEPRKGIIRCPIMPIRTIKTLNQFEIDLCNREFLELMVKRAMAAHSNIRIEASNLLAYVLGSIISIELLVHFGIIEKPNSSRENNVEVKSFPNFRLFFARVTNALSHASFGRILDYKPIEKFLCLKILAQHKSRLHQQQRNQAIEETKKEITKADSCVRFEASVKEEPTSSNVSVLQLAQADNETDFDENSNESEQQFRVEDDSSTEETENPESICEEQDFEFV